MFKWIADRLAQYHQTRARNTTLALIDKLDQTLRDRDMSYSAKCDKKRETQKEIIKIGAHASAALIEVVQLRRGCEDTIVLAVDLLGKFKADSAAPALLRLLQWKGELRECAAVAIGEIGSLAAAPEIVKLLLDKKIGNRFVYAEALGKLRCDAAVHALAAVLNDKDSYVRKSAIESLGRIGDDSIRAPLIAIVLSDSRAEDDVRLVAVDSLVNAGLWPACPELRAKLSICAGRVIDEDITDIVQIGTAAQLISNSHVPRIRANAVVTISALKHDQVVPLLITTLQCDTSYDVREAAAKALALQGDTRAAGPLLEIVSIEEDPRFEIASYPNCTPGLHEQAWKSLLQCVDSDSVDRLCVIYRETLVFAQAKNCIETLVKLIQLRKNSLTIKVLQQLSSMPDLEKRGYSSYKDALSNEDVCFPTSLLVDAGQLRDLAMDGLQSQAK